VGSRTHKPLDRTNHIGYTPRPDRERAWPALPSLFRPLPHRKRPMRPVRAAGSRWGGAPRPRSGNLPRQHRIMVRRALVESQTPWRCEKPARTRAANPVLGHDRHKAAPDLRFCPSGHSRPKQKTTPSPQRQCRRRTGRAIPPVLNRRTPAPKIPNPTETRPGAGRGLRQDKRHNPRPGAGRGLSR